MIKVDNLSYSFPDKDLYNNISFTIEEGQHCAFIGTSGSGKSTLIDMIMDPEKYMYDGDLEIAPNCRIGYVSQFSGLDTTNEMTVFEYIGETFIKLQNEITSICTEMETASDLETLLEKYQEALDAFEAIGGDDFESKITKQLSLANLSKHENLMVSKLSGGEFKLIQVIKEMLTSKDLLIMDEPDVFLDFENLNSLKNLINAHKGTLLVITHNRYLLNHCFNKIIHLENMDLQEFDGRYIDYNFSLLENKIELQELATADTEEIERNNQLINKLRTAATNNSEPARGKALKARVKIQERLEARRIKAPFLAIKQPEIQFATDEKSEESTVLQVNGYSVAFNEPLLENVNFEVKSTEKIALIGPNGCGKSTLLRAIFKNEHQAIAFSEDAQVALLSQLQGEMLDESQTIREVFFEAGLTTDEAIHLHLMKYSLEEKSLQTKISTLSGGEKNMLQLAKLSLLNADFLLLDEPTSHLDTYSQIALEKALTDYNGAILMISHDFYSIINCMDAVLIIDDKTVRKMSMRKFRKMIYANHFNKDYLEIEQKKKDVELKIELALKENDFVRANILCEELATLIQQL
ncbi:ATP-binding cassette domain-containing protein [Niameybacter massiliensis]|uniref:ATP-binding cassette domain-containing protein n=1 Tax=Holtiella tumoricola TaxID=3018743 RepID=A0AA42J111_9FIRM|nr:ATP-binding cassette domain-containing protein [Holtiella tumoricola]MDA3731972.1 ATP-binding cassette domain-containing protein [Holtiella tumoricola]